MAAQYSASGSEIPDHHQVQNRFLCVLLPFLVQMMAISRVRGNTYILYIYLYVTMVIASCNLVFVFKDWL